MKIYFDSCAIQRPLDRIDHLRMALEIEALLAIYEQIDSGAIDLVSSEPLELELSRIAMPTRKLHALNFLAKAKEFIVVDTQIEQRARYFASLGIKPLDALHLACAEVSMADYFCTCDDRLFKKARLVADLDIIVVAPLKLAEELDL